MLTTESGRSMKPGHRIHQVKGTIDYKRLRQVNPEAARKAVLEYLGTNYNISQAARLFGINRTVVYDILKKDREGDLKGRSRGHPSTSRRRHPQ